MDGTCEQKLDLGSMKHAHRSAEGETACAARAVMVSAALGRAMGLLGQDGHTRRIAPWHLTLASPEDVSISRITDHRERTQQ